MGSTGHLSVQQGKKVIVHLKDGSKIVGRYKEKKSKTVWIRASLGIGDKPVLLPIPTDSIRTISIYAIKSKWSEE